ncbi:AAA family ATPase [Litorilituus lipolyticus]|uniref:General secretion pathway protein GspA n=1 Tax=Litorilituus lipolyticus TaxID=2491017 RepID=A0A502L3P4_9GAMM|nr:AAA family ATPase [Litorilituus lipolyticus]TPH18588.1 general secretion pathway protein GspA [Litorilituus lipolyticus]
MYRNFFALSELPFSISPDPKYLFMSERHREALGHLTYGLAETGGFALLTGEVGTGKTTVSRCLMEQLPENTQVAFILNPTLSSQELLATICDQLKIKYRKTGATSKTLTDKISEKLLKNHEQDINTLLIIDEAQHLEAEVLEQLRLLTNLETNTKKLLQVILIGQPELQQLLQRRDLRQLAQRLTARYHLLPLTKQELKQYINHRLSVAQCHRSLFSDGAINKIHQFSQGIPRLINLLCHQALMLAYNKNESLVSKKTIVEAAKQALGDEFHQQKNEGSALWLKAIAASSMLFVVLVAGFWWGNTTKNQQLVSHTTLSGDNEPTELAVNKSAVKAKVDETAEAASLAVESTDNVNITGQAQEAQSNVINSHTVNETQPQVEQKLTKLMQTELKQANSSEPLVNDTADATTPLGGESNKVAKQAEQLIINGEKKITKPVDFSDSADTLNDIDGVSPELLALFKEAVNETEDESTANESKYIPSNEQVKPITQMPNWVQNGVPSLNFEQHIYASDGEGWVTVNGRDRYEGDMITNDLKVKAILPQKVILTYRGETFSLPALTNW